MLLMVTPGTQTLFDEIRNAAHKVEDSIVAQNLFDEALNAVNELSVKSTRAGKNTNVQDGKMFASARKSRSRLSASSSLSMP